VTGILTYTSLVDACHVVEAMNPIKYWTLVLFQPTVPKYHTSQRSHQCSA